MPTFTVRKLETTGALGNLPECLFYPQAQMVREIISCLEICRSYLNLPPCQQIIWEGFLIVSLLSSIDAIGHFSGSMSDNTEIQLVGYKDLGWVWHKKNFNFTGKFSRL